MKSYAMIVIALLALAGCTAAPVEAPDVTCSLEYTGTAYTRVCGDVRTEAPEGCAWSDPTILVCTYAATDHPPERCRLTDEPVNGQGVFVYTCIP